MAFGPIRRWQTRRQVNAALANRPRLSKQEWYDQFWNREGLPRDVVDFIYEKFSGYSGIDFGLVRPADTLEGDLQFRAVCYGDWDLDLFDDVKDAFGVDIRGCVLSDVQTISQWAHQLTKCIDTPEGNKNMVSVADRD
jgi:hypothetical protein